MCRHCTHFAHCPVCHVFLWLYIASYDSSQIWIPSPPTAIHLTHFKVCHIAWLHEQGINLFYDSRLIHQTCTGQSIGQPIESEAITESAILAKRRFTLTYIQTMNQQGVMSSIGQAIEPIGYGVGPGRNLWQHSPLHAINQHDGIYLI